MKHPSRLLRFVGALLASATLGALSGAAQNNPSTDPFPDFGYMTNANTSPAFQLSQDYPKTKPPLTEIPKFFALLPPKFGPDFELWRPYMMAIRDYCFEGNTTTGWVVQNNPVRKWYHIPWQHYGGSGREGFHGLTKEAPVQPNQLAIGQGQPAPNDFYQTYAVGFFNSFGGYRIGQVWADHMKPNLATGDGFPEGTVICKLLFVDVPTSQVPFLVNPIQWQAYIQQTYFNINRYVGTVSLIQMDIAVRDSRAPLGWIMGTFQYNGALNNSDPWKNLIPVGVMWGNDPTITDSNYTNPQPTVTKINPNLKETAINANTKELPPTHLGWNGRLNGPVDNPQSSCISCHMTAEVPQTSPMSPLFLPKSEQPAVGSTAWMRWFQNDKCGSVFDEGSQSADFSLQLSEGIANFNEWNAPNWAGLFAVNYPPVSGSGSTAAKAAPAAKATLKAEKAPAKKPVKKIYPVVRGATPEGK